MADNISVTDWFTKERKNIFYPEDSDKKLNELIIKLISEFKGETLEQVSDKIYKVLKESDFYNDICSESRLPVCSLFHHSKNTSGIGVCLIPTYSDEAKKSGLLEYGLSEKTVSNYSNKDFKALIRLASLLHDIGKPRSYTSSKKGHPFHYHTTQTKEIITQILEKAPQDIVLKYELKKILPELAARHHSRDSVTKLERLIGKADSVASGADRTYDVDGEFDGSVVTVTSNDKIFPHEINFDIGDLQCLDKPITEIIGYKGKVSKKAKVKKDEDTLLLFKDSIVNGGALQYKGHGTLQYEGRKSEISGNIGLLSLDIMKIQDYIKESDKLPMLRGASEIVELSLEEAYKIISEEVCEEAVLFKGGGNLLALVPVQNSLKEKIETKIKEVSNNGLNVAIAFENYKLSKMTKFDEVLKDIQDKIDEEKSKIRKEEIIKPKNRNDVCSFCFRRKRDKEYQQDKICKICYKKKEIGKEQKSETMEKYFPKELAQKYSLKYPNDLDDIGSSIAVVTIDGNMMGRMFTQTKTPAEYNYKSKSFDDKFKDIIKETVKEFIENSETRKLIEHNKFAGLDIIYVGGDDALIIMNAKGAIHFCELLINKVSNKFKFSKKFSGNDYINPTVTVSCGIAIAHYKFPIYFLIDNSKKMENKAKKEFRNKTETDKYNIIKLPDGSIGFNAISEAMPTEEGICFVIPDNKEIGILKSLISKSLSQNGSRSTISSLITCGDSDLERVNFIKSIYSSGFRKNNPAEWIEECEWMIEIMTNKELLKSAKMLVPQIWHEEEKK